MALFKRKLSSSSITTVNQIEKICLNDTIDDKPAYYALQRMATAFKKSGQIDLAISCLRRSNELSDACNPPLLLPDDYMRLVKYLINNSQPELAELELQKINDRHPEFNDKRISNKIRIHETIQRAQNWHCDTVYITTNTTCPICKKYNNKKYSIKGHKHPPLPKEFPMYGGFCKNCIVGIYIDFDL